MNIHGEEQQNFQDEIQPVAAPAENLPLDEVGILSKYLTIPDMKNLRLTSKILKEKCTIMNSSLRYYSIQITDENLDSTYLDFCNDLENSNAQGLGPYKLHIDIRGLKSSKDAEIILKRHQEDIQSLEVRGNEEFLIEEKWKFESLERLSFILAVMKGTPLASVYENMINRHADTLKSLTVEGSLNKDTQPPKSLKKLTSLKLSSLSGSFAGDLIRVAAGSLTSLEMFAVNLGLKDSDVRVANLTTLILMDMAIPTTILFGARDKLKVLKLIRVKLPESGITDYNFPNLKALLFKSVKGDVSTLLRANAQHLETLELTRVNLDPNDMANSYPALRSLWLDTYDWMAVLDKFSFNKNSVENLILFHNFTNPRSIEIRTLKQIVLFRSANISKDDELLSQNPDALLVLYARSPHDFGNWQRMMNCPNAKRLLIHPYQYLDDDTIDSIPSDVKNVQRIDILKYAGTKSVTSLEDFLANRFQGTEVVIHKIQKTAHKTVADLVGPVFELTSDASQAWF